MEYNITYRQKDKGWQFIISYKVNGKWKQKSKQGFKTKKEAKPIAEKEVLKLKKFLKGHESILDNSYDSILFSSLHDLFIEHMKLYRAFNTVDNYKCAYKCFGSLHDMRVAQIKKIHLQNEIDTLIKSGIKPSSIDTYVKRLKQFFIYYKENFDPSYELPTYKLKIPKAAESNKKALTLKETDNMLKDLKDNHFYIFILLCVRCGLRRGEALGVTWNDIDEINMTINIDKQWKLLIDGTWGFGDTKNKKIRKVPISESLLKELKEYKTKSVTDINNRIFPHAGKYVSQTVNVILKPYGITIHELRHTFTTNLIAHGVDFKTAADIIGDSVEMVLKTYSHVHDDMMQNAKNIISNIF